MKGKCGCLFGEQSYRGAAKVLGQNNSQKNGIISKIFSNKSFYLRVSSKKNNFISTNAQIDHLLPRYRRRDVS